MGLGLVEPRFMTVNEEDIGLGAVHNADVMNHAEVVDKEAQEQDAGEAALVNVDGDPVEVVEIQD